LKTALLEQPFCLHSKNTIDPLNLLKNNFIALYLIYINNIHLLIL